MLSWGRRLTAPRGGQLASPPFGPAGAMIEAYLMRDENRNANRVTGSRGEVPSAVSGSLFVVSCPYPADTMFTCHLGNGTDLCLSLRLSRQLYSLPPRHLKKNLPVGTAVGTSVVGCVGVGLARCRRGSGS